MVGCVVVAAIASDMVVLVAVIVVVYVCVADIAACVVPTQTDSVGDCDVVVVGSVVV